VLWEADELPPTAVGFDVNSLDVCDLAFSLAIVSFAVSTGAVLSTGHVSSVRVNMQRVGLSTVAQLVPGRRDKAEQAALLL
jgi:hypothetical protein